MATRTTFVEAQELAKGVKNAKIIERHWKKICERCIREVLLGGSCYV